MRSPAQYRPLEISHVSVGDHFAALQIDWPSEGGNGHRLTRSSLTPRISSRTIVLGSRSPHPRKNLNMIPYPPLPRQSPRPPENTNSAPRLQTRCGIPNLVSNRLLQEHEHLVIYDPSALFIRCTGTERQKATPAVELRKLMIAVFHFQKHDLPSDFILRPADMIHRA